MQAFDTIPVSGGSGLYDEAAFFCWTVDRI